MEKMKNAIILCSGGLDSITVANYVKKRLRYSNLIFLFFNYSQRTLKQERYFSKKAAKTLNAKFIEIDLGFISKISTSLINKNKKSREIKRKELKDSKEESNKWYVPMRNSFFLVYALALAESEIIKNNKKFDIFVGFKNEGIEHYPDTTKEYVVEMNKLSEIAIKKNIKIIAPLIDKDKEDIILIGKELDIKFENTYSCYSGSKSLYHCGTCLACRLRQEGFYWANIKDKTKYFKKMKDFRLAK